MSTQDKTLLDQKKTFGLKFQIIAKVFIVFIIIWSLFIFLWYKKLDKDFTTQIEKNLFSQNNQLNNIIENEKFLLLWELKNITRIVFRKEKPDIANLGQSLEILTNKDKISFFQHYALNGDVKLNFNAPKNDIIKKSFLNKIIEEPRPHFFFSCSDICYLNAIKVANETQLKYGIFRKAIPVDHILNKFKAISRANIISLKIKPNRRHQHFLIKNYSIDGYTSLSSKESLKLAYNTVKLFNTNMIKQEGKHLIVKHLNHELNNTVIFLSIENVSYIYSLLYENLWRIFYASFSILALTLILLYLLLNKSLYQLKTLINIMGLIGNSHFKKASLQLKQHANDHSAQEIALIFKTTNDLVERIQETHEHLTYTADYDSLTQLSNRRKMTDFLNEESQHQHKKFALIAIDIDFFKIINDTQGHAAGDLLLKELAKTLAFINLEGGLAGRIGGDEFLLMLPYQYEIDITSYLESLKYKTSNINIKQYNIANISLSIGVSLFPKHSRSIEQLIIFADAAMYENKRYKKHSFHLYNGKETLLQAERERQYFNHIISESLMYNSIHVYFQPVFLSKDKSVYSYEALSRFMNNKTNKLILPAKIISHAEKSHSIINLDRKIFEVAVKKASREKTEPLIMINMSNITITSLNLEDYITNTLRKYNYPPNRIILEVTESSEITNFSDVNNFINNMNKIGIEFSLDDFGAGFSSFIYLKLLKISYLKIDKKIIKGLLDNKADNYILSAIALLTKKFNIKTIAEGVENEVILNAVHHYDIDFLQGFHLARPVENAFEAYPCHQQAANTGS